MITQNFLGVLGLGGGWGVIRERHLLQIFLQNLWYVNMGGKTKLKGEVKRLRQVAW